MGTRKPRVKPDSYLCAWCHKPGAKVGRCQRSARFAPFEWVHETCIDPSRRWWEYQEAQMIMHRLAVGPWRGR